MKITYAKITHVVIQLIVSSIYFAKNYNKISLESLNLYTYLI